MGCCGRSKNRQPATIAKGTTTPSAKTPETKPQLISPVQQQPTQKNILPPAKPARNVFSKQTVQIPPQNQKPVPQSTPAVDDIPPCRYREFKSKQTIGGRERENYFCKAFGMNVGKEHCRVCQKHDK